MFQFSSYTFKCVKKCPSRQLVDGKIWHGKQNQQKLSTNADMGPFVPPQWVTVKYKDKKL